MPARKSRRRRCDMAAALGATAPSASTPSGSTAAQRELDDGAAREDDWSKLQAGLPRRRAAAAHNRFTRAGRLPERSIRDFAGVSDVGFAGANVLGRWEHAGDRVSTRVQVYLRPRAIASGRRPGSPSTSTPTISISSRAPSVGARHQLVWGLGRRYNDYHTVNNDLAFVPDHRTLELTNVFVQDAITLTEEFKLTAGIKFEDNSYSDWSALPDLRLSWAPNDKTLFWLAGSRAIRSPTPFDTDVQEFVGGQLFVLGDPDFKTEKVTAYELGYRGNPDASVSFSASVFYNEYDDLRTIEVTPVHVPAAALGQSHGGQRLWRRSLGESPARRPGGACRPGSARCTSGSNSAKARPTSSACGQAGNDPIVAIPAQVFHGSAAASASTRCCARSARCRTRRSTTTPSCRARFAWQASERLEARRQGLQST